MVLNRILMSHFTIVFGDTVPNTLIPERKDYFATAQSIQDYKAKYELLNLTP